MPVNKLLAAYEKGDVKSLVTILEKQALASSKESDIPAFNKAYSQLKPLYNLSSTSPHTTKSSTTVIGLHLLILLSASQISNFHSDLESLPASVLGSTEIQWVRKIEQGITEGSYTDVRHSLSSPPNKNFEIWGDLMVTSIRSEIAECSESAYESLPLINLTTLLLLRNVKETEQFAQERGWEVKHSRVYFPSKKTEENSYSIGGTASAMEVDGEVPSGGTTGPMSLAGRAEQMISQTLGYAKELESIV